MALDDENYRYALIEKFGPPNRAKDKTGALKMNWLNENVNHCR